MTQPSRRFFGRAELIQHRRFVVKREAATVLPFRSRVKADPRRSVYLPALIAFEVLWNTTWMGRR